MKRIRLESDDPEKYRTTYSAGGLPILNIWLTRECDLCCVYCATDAGEPDDGELTSAEIKGLISQAKELGCETVSINGRGEPTLDSSFIEVAEHIGNEGMKLVLSTNGRSMTRPTAKLLKNIGADIVVKVVSFRPNVYNSLAGVKNAHRKAYDGLGKLLAAGFGALRETENEIITDISAMYLLAKPAKSGFSNFLYLCKARDMYPMIDGIVADGRVLTNRNLDELAMTPGEEEELSMTFRKIMEYPPEGGQNEDCPIRMGMFIDNQGNIRADSRGNSCDVPYKDTVGSVKEAPLAELWERLKAIREAAPQCCGAAPMEYRGFPLCFRMRETQEAYRNTSG